MARLNKIASGLLMRENFNTNSMVWTPSPNNYTDLSFDSDGMRIKPSDTYKTITIQEPQDNYCFACKLNHIPTNMEDIGGVVVMSNDTSYVECQSYIATKHSYVTNLYQAQQIVDYIDLMLEGYVTYTITDDTGTYPNPASYDVSKTPFVGAIRGSMTNYTFEDIMYPYIKFVKKNTVYSFFASTDGIKWIEVGNTALEDSHRVGFFLHSQEDLTEADRENSHFYVEDVMFYSSNYAIINNIKKTWNLELWDTSGNLVASSRQLDCVKKIKNSFYIDTTLLPVPYEDIRVVLLDETETIIVNYITDLIGGDQYEYSFNIGVFIDNVEVNQEEIFELEAFDSHKQVVKIDIHNYELYEIKDLKVSIAPYSVYYDGNETIDISLYDVNEENYNFHKAVVIDSILPSEGKSVLLKLSDRVVQNFYMKEGVFRFKLNIEI